MRSLHHVVRDLESNDTVGTQDRALLIGLDGELHQPCGRIPNHPFENCMVILIRSKPVRLPELAHGRFQSLEWKARRVGPGGESGDRH